MPPIILFSKKQHKINKIKFKKKILTEILTNEKTNREREKFQRKLNLKPKVIFYSVAKLFFCRDKFNWNILNEICLLHSQGFNFGQGYSFVNRCV